MPEKQKITAEEWESHRAVIKRLYVDEEMKLHVVMAEMGEKHGFWPSKSQYETAFKKWNWRKNLVKSELEFVDRRIKKRKAANKKTEVYLNGVLIPAKRVKRELNRHFTPCYQQPYTAAPSPQTPPDISFRTPRDMAVQPRPDIALDIAARTPQDMAIEPPSDIVPLDLVVQIPHYMAVQTPKNPANSEIRLDTLPWFQFQWCLESNAYVVSRIFRAGKYRVRPPIFSFLSMITSQVWALDSSVQSDLSPAQLGSVESFMQDVSLERNPGEFQLSIQKLLGPFSFNALTEFLKHMAYLSSNNMLLYGQSDRLLEWVIETNNRSALEAFFSVKLPTGTIKAFATSLFESVLRIKDAAALRILLKAGVDPGLPIKTDDRTPLLWAVRGRNTELVRILLDEGVDVNTHTEVRNPYYGVTLETALSVAVSTCSVETVRMLLDAGADTETMAHGSKGPDTADHFYKAGTALQHAVSKGNVELVRLLLAAGADANAQCIGSLSVVAGTAIQRVASEKNYEDSIEITRLLLGAGADVNAPCYCHNSALWLAALHGVVEIVRMLLDAGAVVDNSIFNEYTTLMNAAKSGSVETVQMLLDAGADVNAGVLGYPRYGNALTVAASGNSVEIVRVLLHAGADVNIPADSPSYNPLNQAAGRGSVEIVRMLLDAGANVNAACDLDEYALYPPYGEDYGTALKMAAESGSAATAQMLLEAGADVHAPTGCHYSLLIQPVKRRSVDIVRMLLEAGADCNTPADSFGYSPLKMAAMCSSAEIVQMLLDEGAEVNAGTGSSTDHSDIDCNDALYREDEIDLNYGFTALQAAAKRGDVEIVRMLLDAGADVRAPENSPLPWLARSNLQHIARQSHLMSGIDHNISPDHCTIKIATQNSHNILLQALLDAGADVDAIDWYERTALAIAIGNGNYDLAQALLDAGADVNATDWHGRTALGAAVLANEIDLVEKLLDVGAEVDVAHPLRYDSDPCDMQAFDVIVLAALEGNGIIVELLIDAGADVNASAEFIQSREYPVGDYCFQVDGKRVTISALLCAVWSKDVELIELLLNSGANVNPGPEPYFGWTALQAAAYHGNTELVQILLDAGADINAPPYERGGRTTLQVAVIEGHTALARSLLKAGADANAPAAERSGVTALQAAAIKGYLGIALSLIEAGADPNAPPAKHQGRTALEGAAEHGRLDMVEFLLSAGANILDIPRACALAEKERHFVIVEYLERFYDMGTITPVFG